MSFTLLLKPALSFFSFPKQAIMSAANNNKDLAKASQRLMSRHPLQRLNSPGRGVSAAVHLLGLSSFAFSFYYLAAFPNFVNEAYGWHWQYLTIIGLTISTATFVVGLLADATLSPQLFLLKNALSVVSTPLEVLISILYWSISAIDRTLVMPPEVSLDPRADISFHLMPALVLTIDLLFLSPPWTINALPAMGVSGVFAFGYWAWVEQCYRHNGWYPYPLFAILSTTQRVLLFAGAALTMTASTAMLKWLYGRVNGLQGAQNRSTPSNVNGKIR